MRAKKKTASPSSLKFIEKTQAIINDHDDEISKIKVLYDSVVDETAEKIQRLKKIFQEIQDETARDPDKDVH
jgi:hypothetical protein